MVLPSVLSKVKISVSKNFSGIRIYAAAAIALYFLVFAAGQIFNGGSVFYISTATYVLMLLIAVVLLAFPNLSNERFFVLLAGTVALYIAATMVLGLAFVAERYIFELGILTVALALLRSLSNTLLSYEEDYQKLVTDVDATQVLPYGKGRRKINQEIFRLQRFERQVSMVYCRVFEEDSYPYTYMQITNETIQRHIDEMYKQRRYQVQLARSIQSLIYKSDIVVQHGDSLVICLPETNEEEAKKFVERLRVFVQSSIGANLIVGIATCPQEGKTFDQLMDIARGKMRMFMQAEEDTTNITRRGDVLVDIEQRLEIEKKSEWLNNFVYQSPGAKAIYRPIKRLMDITASFIALLLLSPIFVVVALAIYLDDRGPIIYMQDRTGFGGKRFRMYKFRSMYVNAPTIPSQKIITADGQVRYIWPDKDEDDPRITRIGRFIRKTSLDEMPQILNVLRGDMSLVGPRPTTWDVSQYTLYQTERLTVQPGITGLWQVSARESKNPDERLLWDLKYVEKMSLWLDIQILWLTVLQVVKKKGI